jgi:regulatory protein
MRRSTKRPEPLDADTGPCSPAIEERLTAWSEDIGTGRALQVAYRFLNRRERTVAEMRARLDREQEIPAEETEAAIIELLDYGYLDDARYARVFAEDRRNLDQWGVDRITRALRERGIDRELIAAALSELTEVTQQTELDRAIALLALRFPTGPRAPRDRDRAFGVLIRKGYDSDLSADAVRAWARF